jgi:uncharacterized membrane protein YcaP (DUF421 family)
LANIILRTVVLFVALLAMLRLMGKRQIGQLQPYEFTVMLISSNLVTVPMSDLATPLSWGIIPIYVLLFLGLVLSEISLKSTFLRKIICSTPKVLIDRGIILEQALKDVRYTLNDLLEQLRSNDVFDISDVYYAILETNGEISVILKSQKRTVQPMDLNFKPKQDELNIALIMDGKVQKENLKYIKKDMFWLKSKTGQADFDKILLAVYDGSHLYIHFRNQKIKEVPV